MEQLIGILTRLGDLSKQSRVRWSAHVPRVLVTGAIGAGTALFGFDASANCAMPTTYQVTVSANTVTICPKNHDGRGCPDAGGMLREGSGSVVKLADRCVGGTGAEGCYVDECVPKGEYKYGFLTPYECCESCCGTDYYATATVVNDPPTPCVPAGGGNGGEGGASPYAGGVPWGDSSSICDYGGGAANGGGQKPSPSSNDGCSCRIGARVDPRKLVFAANGALVIFGFFLSRRRRRA